MAAIWINDDYWICTSHMRAVRLPAGVGSCWYAGCKSHRPQGCEHGAGAPPQGGREVESGRVAADGEVYEARHQQRLERGERSLHSDALAPEELLERFRQAQEAARRPAVAAQPETLLASCEWHKCDNGARPGSKYCSRKCSNKNARARYLKRQQASAATRRSAVQGARKRRSAA